MDEEEAVGVIFILDREQPGVVFAPERLLPMRLEVICLPHVGANARQELTDCVHRFVHGLGLGPRGRRVRLMSRAAGFIAVSFVAAIASAVAPAMPLLQCSATPRCLAASKSASARLSRRSVSRSEAGSQAERWA